MPKFAPIKNVVVHGATGKQGGSVVRALASSGYKVRAAVRDPEAPKARELAALDNVQLAVIDLEDLDSLVAAYTDADAVYACTVPGPSEVAHGKRMADASKAVGIRLHIFPTLRSVERVTNGELKVKNFDDKAIIADYITSLGLPSTFVYLGAFMENFVNVPGFASVKEGKVHINFGAVETSRKLPLVHASKDIGQVVKIIVSHPDDFVGQSIGLGNISLSIDELAKIIQKLSDSKAEGEKGPWVPSHFPFAESANNTFKFVNEDKWGGYFGDIPVPSPLLEKHGFKPASFEDFVRESFIPHFKLSESTRRQCPFSH